MILIFGASDDSCIERVIEAAVDLGVDFRYADQHLLEHDDLSLTIGHHGMSARLRVAGEVIELDDVSAVYARPLGTRSPKATQITDWFVEWLDSADCAVVNRPVAMRSNASKPFQAQLIAQVGLEVPETVVTNDPAVARAFYEAHERVIFKSISGIRSIVKTLDDSRLAHLDRIRALPTQFQRWEPGTDVRVHVVGVEVFATEIVCEAIDYRYARQDDLEVEHRAIELDDVSAAQCRELAVLLGLPLCGIDLRRRPDGSYVCFEVNPMPAYSYYEAHGGQPISTALVEYLAGKA
jgi:glutathione synthase/RimK-type ligase-like ATP-grasp enzyme